jgi:hypothetical protein
MIVDLRFNLELSSFLNLHSKILNDPDSAIPILQYTKNKFVADSHP